MISLPPSFEERMKIVLKEEYELFFQALQEPAPASVRLNPDKPFSSQDCSISKNNPVEWCGQGYYLNERPIFTLDPVFHGGAYYVQEASSMFLSHILKQILPQTPVRMLDLCAAPGGKSTLAASTLPVDSLLVSNEVIRSRASILKENIIKWGNSNIVVTNNDPADFKNLEGAFDIILVDAPCSGEGMFRKDAVAIEEWNENNLSLCSERQQRIISDIWNCLKPGGYLIYSTCTYNPKENETVLEWIADNFDAQNINIEHSFKNIVPGNSSVKCYRFYPHKMKGEGFFVGVMQKNDGKEFSLKRNKKQHNTKPALLPDEAKELIMAPENYTTYQKEDVIGIIPSVHKDFISVLDNELRVIYKGCEIVEYNNRKFKPLHSFALWSQLNKDRCTIYETDKTTALTYLKKEDIPPIALKNGWILVTHRDIALGWCKNLGNRLNNYYPKEWRIRMDIRN